MDLEFFEQMAFPLFDSLYNLAHWLTGDRTEAEDLVQETYTKALRGFKSFQEGTNIRPWMFRILRNTFLTSRSGLIARNTSWLKDEDMDVNLTAARTDIPEALLLRHENRQTVVDALERLPAQYHEVLSSAKWKCFRTVRSLKYFRCQSAQLCHAYTGPNMPCAIH
jgi:RNA polymerase sigma-70 factor (ECF subfamily)